MLVFALIGSAKVLAQALPASGPAVPPPSVATPAATTREAELEARVRQLESLVDRLSTQVETLTRLPGIAGPRPAAPGAAEAAAAAGLSPPEPGGNAPANPTGSSALSGLGATAGSQPESPESPLANMPAGPLNKSALVKLGPGFEISTNDSEYQIQFHDLTQFDGRYYIPGNQQSVHDTFVIPRQWFIFSGRLTKPFEYYVSLAEGFDNVNILDVFLNIHFDDRLQFKIGRYKTPFTYEFYNGPINAIIQPERSLFFNNFGLNRDLGMMAWGQLFQKRIDYAVGVFNGTRNGFLDANDDKDIAAYVNFRPFGESGIPALENFNVGGSVEAGSQFNTPIPQVLRTNVATTGNLILGPEFLAFNNNVREAGFRTLWSLHAAWYYRHLSLIGEWQSGFQDYALTNALAYKTHLPIESYYVQAGYFITGETVNSRGMVRPIRNFDLRPGKFGLGAIEPMARYNPLNIGNEIFTHGLADPNNWTNNLYTYDIGVNWYWTQHVKLTFDWEHAQFGQPVLVRPGGRVSSIDQVLFRFQIYF